MMRPGSRHWQVCDCRNKSFYSHQTMFNAKEARRARFLDVYPVIRDELVEYVRGHGLPELAVEWYRRVSR
jgi:hypothetical protein